MEASRHQEIIALAQRLAQREGVDPAWIDYPAWSGVPLGAEAILKKAAEFRKRAAAILSGELDRPAWLVREDRRPVHKTPARKKQPPVFPRAVKRRRARRSEPEPVCAGIIDREAAAPLPPWEAGTACVMVKSAAPKTPKKKKVSFVIGDRKPISQRIAEAERAKAKHIKECQQPTYTEIADLAIILAMEDPVHGPRLNLGRWSEPFFHWPNWAPPTMDPRGILLQPFIKKFKAEAEEQLRRHYEYYYSLKLKRERWLRAHPIPRSWAWTKRPLKHAVPPPRLRMFRPPGIAYPDRGSPPPPPLPDGSPNRPGWREREVLLCFTWGISEYVFSQVPKKLFDNRIAVYKRTSSGVLPSEIASLTGGVGSLYNDSTFLAFIYPSVIKESACPWKKLWLFSSPIVSPGDSSEPSCPASNRRG